MVSLLPISSFWLRTLVWLSLAFFMALGVGCATKPVVSPVQITVEASADVNPDSRKRASPITVRVYGLKASSPFEAADFFSLFEKDQATLGADMVVREEMLLRPGESKVLTLTLSPEVKSIAYFAAYRDLDQAKWRGVKPLVVGKPANLRIRVLQKQITAD
jgi:type VI secretion system protein VasD